MRRTIWCLLFRQSSQFGKSRFDTHVFNHDFLDSVRFSSTEKSRRHKIESRGFIETGNFKGRRNKRDEKKSRTRFSETRFDAFDFRTARSFRKIHRSNARERKSGKRRFRKFACFQSRRKSKFRDRFEMSSKTQPQIALVSSNSRRTGFF